MESFNIKIESVPKHSPETAKANVQTWNLSDLEAAREVIARQRAHHQKNSKWFKIYQDDKLIFDSKCLIR